MTVADDDVLDLACVYTQHPKVVHEDGARESDVEQDSRFMPPASCRHEQADSVLRLWRSAPLIKMFDQAGSHAVAIAEIHVRQKHVDPVLDQDNDLDAVGLEDAHQMIASGLTGEPTAPVIGSGGAEKKNS